MVPTLDAAPARTYRPYGAARAIFACRDREVLLHGPRGTGKSIAWLVKLYSLAEKYAGMRGSILRKHRVDLTDAALVTWENHVVPPGHPCLKGAGRPDRRIYNFPNGSQITVRGLDDSDKTKSSEADFVYIQEISELDEDDLIPIMGSMRNNVMPYQQIGGDTNPGPPDHWLRYRFGMRGNLTIGDEELVSRNVDVTAFKSLHEDNPMLWDMEKREWTEFGASYIRGLDAIPNKMKRLRDRYGIWAGAEGAVYDSWDAERDVIDDCDLPGIWPRYVGLDFGGANTAALFYACDPDTDTLYLYREYHAGGRTAGQHAFYLRLHEPADLYVVGGAQSEGQWRDEFRAAGLTVHEPEIKDVALGIARVYGQHKRGSIKVFRSCTGYLGQKTDYRYKRDSLIPGEIERKHQYHFMDAERYIVGYLRPELVRLHSGPGRRGVARAQEQ